MSKQIFILLLFFVCFVSPLHASMFDDIRQEMEDTSRKKLEPYKKLVDMAKQEGSRANALAGQLYGVICMGHDKSESGYREAARAIACNEALRIRYPNSSYNCYSCSGGIADGPYQVLADGERAMRAEYPAGNGLTYRLFFGIDDVTYEITDNRNVMRFIVNTKEPEKSGFIDVHVPVVIESARQTLGDPTLKIADNELIARLNIFYREEIMRSPSNHLAAIANSILLEPSVREYFVKWLFSNKSRNLTN